jgi:ribose-phosphate pyrophosphokinase
MVPTSCPAPAELAPTHPLRIFTGTANVPLAEEVATYLNVSLGGLSVRHLPDTEIHVQIDEVVRGDDVFIIQPCSAPVNDNLIELLLCIDAMRRASAHCITVVIPYFPYARQERMARGREAISARVVATMLETMGATRVIYVDVHAEAIQGFFRIPVDPLTAMRVLAERLRREGLANSEAVIVSPDVGRARLANRYAEMLELPLVLMHKRRQDFDSVRATHIVGEIEGKIPIVVDDVISGGSVLAELHKLVEAGARPEIIVSITHGVLSARAMQALDNPIIKRLFITNTICQPESKRQHPKITVVSIAQLLADIIWNIYLGRSISALIRENVTP